MSGGGSSFPCDSFASEYSSSDEEGDKRWCPGDGVCPPNSQFIACYRASHKIWSDAASTYPENSKSIHFYLEAFLNLLDDVPPFFHDPPKDLNLRGHRKYPLGLRFSLELETVGNIDCDQRWKSFLYAQCLGVPSPLVYKTSTEGQLPEGTPFYFSAPHSGYLISITLAWSYIISCRWVEIFQQAGYKSLLLHDQGAQMTDCFWDLVTQSRWLAQVEIGKRTLYSPWMLREKGKKQGKSSDLVAASPDSSRAFDILLDFCTSEGFESEFLLGLASVLIVTSQNVPSPIFAPPTMISRPAVASVRKDSMFPELFCSLDKCMSLSSTTDALDSLLCSAFFDPSVPCNLLGAASLGIKNALLSPDGTGKQRLLDGIASKTPHLSFLWAAAVYTNQAESLLRLVLDQLPSLCLHAAFWTNTLQSFLQVVYQRDSSTGSTISRAEEFQISHFCRPAPSVPWSPSPPFGSTKIQNLSLEVKEHLEHGHRPRSWRIYWVLDSGERIPASARYQVDILHAHIAQYPDSGGVSTEYVSEHVVNMYPDISSPSPGERAIADGQSRGATSRLFWWHRDYDDGLWLDDGTENIEAIRRVQLHP